MNLAFGLPKILRKRRNLFFENISIKIELAELEKLLLQNPQLGTALGNHLYKIRISIKSKGKGKSGGARVINYLEIVIEGEPQTVVNLISIYDKSEVSTLTEAELLQIIRGL